MINPVLKKELKTRMRTWKTPIMLSTYIFILSLFIFFIFIETFSSYRYAIGFRLENLKDVYVWVVIIQLALITFIVPAITSGSISGERERRTFDLLICTKLSSLSIILGKLSASLSQVILLLFVSLPILGILFLFGGFSPGNIFVIFMFFLCTSIFFGSVGIFTSSMFKRSITSTVASYLIILFFLGGTYIIVLMLARLLDPHFSNPNIVISSLLYTSPLTGLLSIISHQLGDNILDWFFRGSRNMSVLKPLYMNLIFELVASSILIYLSSLKINPMRSFRWRKAKAKTD